MKINAKTFYFAMILLLALSLFAIGGSYYWGKGMLEEESLDTAVLKAQLDASNEAVSKLQSAQVESSEIDDVNTVLDRLLPKTKEQDKLVADIIYTATAEANIPFTKVNTFSFSGGGNPDSLSGTTKSKEYTGVYEYPFSLTIGTISYDSFINLLEEIETNGRIIQVESTSITPNRSENTIDVTIQMKAYLIP